jgi:hypothetical protein
LVSTNSITQGEQVAVLWPDIFASGIEIFFAHRTFQWSSEARGKAAVHCVIIGLTLENVASRVIFDYDAPTAEPQAVVAGNINAYLIDAKNVFLRNRTNAIEDIPAAVYGSKPTDGGHLFLDADERAALLVDEPAARPWLKRFLGADEFLYSIPRYCLWLKDCPPGTLRTLPLVRARVEAVKAKRLASKKAQTREMAKFPFLFGEDRQPASSYLLIPGHTSELRTYIPMGYFSSDVICGNANFLVPGASIYDFGILSSIMHMAWVRSVCGRIKSDYRYSSGIVYNNFPWPRPTEKQRAGIESAAQALLDARAKFPAASLADLYDPLGMPVDLAKAHQSLDKAVDAAYGKSSFASEAERVAFLFERYQATTAPLDVPAPKKARKTAKKAKA